MIRVREARLIVFLLGLLHLASGLGMLVWPSVALVTSLSLLTSLIHSLGPDRFSYVTVACFLVFAGSLAIAAITLSPFLSLSTRIYMVWPQQVLQIFQAASVVLAALAGHYPDGYTPQGGGAFIFFDQLAILLLSIYHTLWMILALARLDYDRSGGGNSSDID